MVGNKKLKKELGEMPVQDSDDDQIKKPKQKKIEELENDEKKKKKHIKSMWSPLSPGEIVPTITITSSDDETSVKKKAGNDSSSSSSDEFSCDSDDESSDDESLNLERSYKDLMSQDNKNFAQLVSISEIAFKLNDLDKIELSVTALRNQATVPAHIWLKYLKARLVVTQTPDERKVFEKKCAKALEYFYNIPLSTFIVNYLVDQGNVENHELWAKLLADYDVERPDFGDKLRPLLSSITDKKEAATFEELLQKHCVSWNCGEKKRKIIQKLVDDFKKDLDKMKTQNCDWNWSKLHKRYVEDVQSLPFDEDIKNAVIRFLFERTLAKFPIADFLWLCYIDFIMGKDGNMKEEAESVEAVAKRVSRLGKGFLRSSALDLAKRGVRSRPSVRLNHRFLNLMELADFKQPDVDQQVRIILKRIEPDMIMTVELHLDYLAYCVRNTNVKDNAQVIRLRSAFNSVWEELSNLYGDKADTSYEVLQLWAQVEYAHLGNPDMASHIWRQIMGYPGSSHRGMLWLSFAQMDSQYNAGRRTPVILRKALSQPVLEDGIKVQEFYRRHERCYGTYESYAACQALELPAEYIEQRFHVKPNSQQVNYRQPQHRQAQPHQAQSRQAKFDQAKPYQEKSHEEKPHKEKRHKEKPDKKNPHQEKPLQAKPHKEKPQQPKPCEEKPEQPKPCEAEPGQQPEENREPLNREQRRQLAHQQKQQQQGHKMSMPKSVSKTTSEDGPPPASEAKLTARPAEETWGSNFKYSPHLEDNKIFLKNLHPDCSEEELHELFGPYGTIKDVRLVRKKHMKLKCIAYVEYESPIEAQRAVAARDGYLLKGMNIVAAISNPPPKDSSLDLPKLSVGSKRRVPTSLIPTILLPHAVAEKKRRLMDFELPKWSNLTDETNKSDSTDQSEQKEPAVPKSNKDFRELFFKD